jgi:hypothetical protein
MDIVSFRFTKASTADVTLLDSSIVKDLSGFLVGDKGYISASRKEKLAQQNLHLITKNRSNMAKQPITKKILKILSSRQRIETVFGQLKDNFNLIYKKARSIKSFFSHLLASIFAYSLSKINLSSLVDTDFLPTFSIS